VDRLPAGVQPRAGSPRADLQLRQLPDQPRTPRLSLATPVRRTIIALAAGLRSSESVRDGRAGRDGALGDRAATPRPSPLLSHPNPVRPYHNKYAAVWVALFQRDPSISLRAQAIRSLAERPEVYTRLQAEAEAAHRELAFEEADISVRKNARGFSIEGLCRFPDDELGDSFLDE